MSEKLTHSPMRRRQETEARRESHVSGAPPPLQNTPTGDAVQALLQRLSTVPEVLHIEQRAGDNGYDWQISVYVHSRLGAEADQVYELKDEILESYPAARLDVWVTEAEVPDVPRRAANDAA